MERVRRFQMGRLKSRGGKGWGLRARNMGLGVVWNEQDFGTSRLVKRTVSPNFDCLQACNIALQNRQYTHITRVYYTVATYRYS